MLWDERNRAKTAITERTQPVAERPRGIRDFFAPTSSTSGVRAAGPVDRRPEPDPQSEDERPPPRQLVARKKKKSKNDADQKSDEPGGSAPVVGCVDASDESDFIKLEDSSDDSDDDDKFETWRHEFKAALAAAPAAALAAADGDDEDERGEGEDGTGDGRPPYEGGSRDRVMNNGATNRAVHGNERNSREANVSPGGKGLTSG